LAAVARARGSGVRVRVHQRVSAANNPFPDQIDSVVHDGPTGFLQISNLGLAIIRIIRIVAIFRV